MAEIPAEFKEDAELYHQELLEAAADCDDELMEKVLMEEEISVDELKAAIRKGVINCQTTPCSWGSALTRTRVCRACWTPWSDYMPSPTPVESRRSRVTTPTAWRGRRATGRSERLPFASLAFKIHDRPLCGQSHTTPTLRV